MSKCEKKWINNSRPSTFYCLLWLKNFFFEGAAGPAHRLESELRALLAPVPEVAAVIPRLMIPEKNSFNAEKFCRIRYF